MVSENIVGETDARSEAGRVGILERGAVAAARQSREIQLVNAGRVHKREFASIRQSRIKIPDMAEIIVERA